MIVVTAADARPACSVRINGRGARVLVVEDNERGRAILDEMLKDLGYEPPGPRRAQSRCNN